MRKIHLTATESERRIAALESSLEMWGLWWKENYYETDEDLEYMNDGEPIAEEWIDEDPEIPYGTPEYWAMNLTSREHWEKAEGRCPDSEEWYPEDSRWVDPSTSTSPPIPTITEVFWQPPPRAQIFVRDLDGATLCFNILTHDSVMDLKMKICDVVGLVPSHQQLLFQGRYLEDSQELSEVGIKKNRQYGCQWAS